MLGLDCNDSTHKCEPKQLPGNGASCQVLDSCGGGTYCNASLFVGGSCQPQNEVGQACSTSTLGGLPVLQSACHYPATCKGASGAEKCVAAGL
jgi:hypothetical protein